MRRKSVSYLTSIRHDVTNTLSEAIQLGTDLEGALVDIAALSPEQIRSDQADEHDEQMKYIKSVHRALGKAIKDHDLAAKNLKSFF